MQPPSRAGNLSDDENTCLESAILIQFVSTFFEGSKVLTSEVASLPSGMEDCGCMLWDLTAGENVAVLLVREAFILDVIEAVLTTHGGAQHKSTAQARMVEFCLGSLANITSHDQLATAVSAHGGLVAAVMEQFMLVDPQPLCELFRLLSVALRKQGAEHWASSLVHDDTPCTHMLWVMTNSLDPVLQARAADLIVALLTYDQQYQQTAAQEEPEQPVTALNASPAQPGSGGGGLHGESAGACTGENATARLLAGGLLPVLAATLSQWAQARTEPGLQQHQQQQQHEQGSHLSDDTIDAVLRAIEALACTQQGCAFLRADPHTMDIMTGLTGILRAPQTSTSVTESLVIAMSALADSSVTANTHAALPAYPKASSNSNSKQEGDAQAGECKDLPPGKEFVSINSMATGGSSLMQVLASPEHADSLLDLLAELPSGSALREGPLYLVAGACRAAQADLDQHAVTMDDTSRGWVDLGKRLIRLFGSAGGHCVGCQYVCAAASSLARLLQTLASQQGASGQQDTCGDMASQLMVLCSRLC